jgi:thiosulfate dehydrogenase [quinone] large subunit
VPRDWALTPLRAFLGLTFTYAGLQKLANPAYLDPSSPQSVQGMIRSLEHRSPIGWMLGLSAHHAVLVGVLIALGELAVGLATLAGLWVRLASIGGLMLSLTFYLTVSWNTTPYYYGSDIVFVAAWTVPLLLGDWGPLTVDGWLRERARAEVAAMRVRGKPLPAALARSEVDRRTVLMGARTAVLLGAFGGLGGFLTAIVGRALNQGPTTPRTARPAPVPSADSSPAAAKAAGVAIAKASDVPAGQAKSFQDPASGDPAWVVHLPGGRFAAYSAICTHAGCTVGFDPQAEEFACPCHGATYDASNGDVTGGPAPAPLSAIKVDVVGGEIRVV